MYVVINTYRKVIWSYINRSTRSLSTGSILDSETYTTYIYYGWNIIIIKKKKELRFYAQSRQSRFYRVHKNPSRWTTYYKTGPKESRKDRTRIKKKIRFTVRFVVKCRLSYCYRGLLSTAIAGDIGSVGFLARVTNDFGKRPPRRSNKGSARHLPRAFVLLGASSFLLNIWQWKIIENYTIIIIYIYYIIILNTFFI